jgi:Spy/CpxP family protein refolding chaperone
MLTKNELREIDIRNEIDELKRERQLTDFEDEVEAIDEKIDKLETEILNMLTPEQEKDEAEYQKAKARMEYDFINNIDMSGASDNGDR